MHDSKFDDPELLQAQLDYGEVMSLRRLKAIADKLRAMAEPKVEIEGKKYYVFRPLSGRNGFYDRQVNDDREE